MSLTDIRVPEKQMTTAEKNRFRGIAASASRIRQAICKNCRRTLVKAPNGWKAQGGSYTCWSTDFEQHDAIESGTE